MTQRERMYSDYVAATAEKVERKYLVSRSVKDCRLTDAKPPTIRVASRVGLTTGRVAGARSDAYDGSQRVFGTKPNTYQPRIRNRRGKGKFATTFALAR